MRDALRPLPGRSPHLRATRDRPGQRAPPSKCTHCAQPIRTHLILALQCGKLREVAVSQRCGRACAVMKKEGLEAFFPTEATAVSPWATEELGFLRRFASALVRVVAIMVLWQVSEYLPDLAPVSKSEAVQHFALVAAFTAANVWLAFDIAALFAPPRFREWLGIKP